MSRASCCPASSDTLLRVPGRRRSRFGDYVSKVASVRVFWSQTSHLSSLSSAPSLPRVLSPATSAFFLEHANLFPTSGPLRGLVLTPKMLFLLARAGSFRSFRSQFKGHLLGASFPDQPPQVLLPPRPCPLEPPFCPSLSTVLLFHLFLLPTIRTPALPTRRQQQFLTGLFRRKPQDPDGAWGPHGGRSHKPPKSSLENVLVFAAVRYL